jgi:hypothetical protein
MSLKMGLYLNFAARTIQNHPRRRPGFATDREALVPAQAGATA